MAQIDHDLIERLKAEPTELQRSTACKTLNIIWEQIVSYAGFWSWQEFARTERGRLMLEFIPSPIHAYGSPREFYECVSAIRFIEACDALASGNLKPYKIEYEQSYN